MFALKKVLFTSHLNVLFQFFLHFNTFRCFLEHYSKLMVNLELYLYEPIRDPPSFSINFLPSKCLIMMICNKKLFNCCFYLKLGWLKLLFERNFKRILDFYNIYLINVVIVVLETHARCHSLYMDS